MPETTRFSPNDTAQPRGALEENAILLARYKIIGVLGGGGQGAVYQARDLNFPDAKRLVAVKEINYPDDLNQREAALKTFQREANILATLSHPAIPRIYDFFDENDRAYLVMEYINGSDIEMLLAKTKHLPVKKIIQWGIELCDVLDYLHNHQPEPIIFRDMKPSNIMIDSIGHARLIDFGIAKIFITGVKQTMIGTEGYSAPEQYRGNASPVSDIYALGASLHHILTRKDPRLEPPFSFDERPINEFNDEVPARFQAIIEKALSFEIPDRYTNCAQMKSELESLLYNSGAATTVPNLPQNVNTTGKVNATVAFSESHGQQGIEPIWTFKTEDEIRANPLFFRGALIVGSYDTNIWALDAENGELIWKYATEGGISSSPAIDTDSQLVLFGSEDHRFSAVDYRTGRISWTYNTNGKIRSSPNASHGHAFFGSDDGHLYSIIASNGRFLWKYDAELEIRTKPFVTNDLIIFGNEGGDLIAVALNGERKWSYRTRRSINSSPVVDSEGFCYFGGFDNFLYALDASSGYSMWRYRTNGPIVSSPVVHDNVVFFGSTDKFLYAIHADTGKVKWKFETEKPIVGSPLVHQDSIYFGGTDGVLYCLNVKNGNELWTFQTDNAITSKPCVANNSLIVCSMDYTVYALPLIS